MPRALIAEVDFQAIVEEGEEIICYSSSLQKQLRVHGAETSFKRFLTTYDNTPPRH